MKYDKQLIMFFLVGYNRLVGDMYAIQEFPDEVGSDGKAVHAIARNAEGRTIAIEHTLIEPFIEEKYDAHKFWKVFGPLETDSSLRFSDFDIELYPKVGAGPKGVDSDETHKAVRRWVASEAGRFPFGDSIQQIHGLPFEVTVLVLKNETVLGRVFVGRSRMPATFEHVLRRALDLKLPKLVSCETSGLILLLEAETNEHNSAAIAEAIETLRPRYPALANVDEVWVADTLSQESYDLRFCKVCPGGVTHRVFVRATLTAKATIPLGQTRILQRQLSI